MKITDEMFEDTYWSDSFEYACDFLQEKYSYSDDEWMELDNITTAKLWETEFNCKVDLVRNTDPGTPLINLNTGDVSFIPISEDAFSLGDITFNTQKDFNNYVEKFCGRPPYIYPYMKYMNELKNDNPKD